MKAATTAAKNTVQREHAVQVKPRLRAEWEYNRFTTPTVAVTPAQTTTDQEWITVFGNLDSVALPNRPRTGVAKARTDSGVRPLSVYRDYPTSARFYPASPSDAYTYWGSVQRSSASISSGSFPFDAPIQITVTYPEAVAVNKLVVGYEMSYAKPVTTTIEVSTNGTTWTTAAVNPVINADGTVELWRGVGGWTDTPNYEFPLVIKAIRLKVYSMDEPLSHLDVLQFGARLENDLTDFIVSYNTALEVTDRSFIAPLGRASSNRATIILNNIDGRFNNHNESSLYYGLIDKKVRFVLDIGVNTTPQAGVGYEYIREFTGWTDAWTGQERTNVEVQLKDSSVFLQEMDMPVVFYEEAAAGAVIWQVLDLLGMTNYIYSRSTLDLGQKIPYYWPESETTAWEEISNIAEATQTAVYFDEYDVLQIRARRAMYADSAVDWNLDAISNGQKLPDIIQTDTSYDLEANSVDIVYQPASFSDFNNGLPKMETVWEPDEDTVVLRASALTRDLTTTGTSLWIKQPDAIVWPYESKVNIRGEILRYKGKEYAYYLANGTVDYKVVYSLEEKNTLDGLNPNLAFKNAFTGRFVIEERQMLGSELSNHKIRPDNYASKITNWENNILYPWTGGVQYLDGFVRQTNNVGAHSNTVFEHCVHLRHHESVITGNKLYFGARIRFPNEAEASQFQNWKIGGLQFCGDQGDTGYYVEVTSTAQVDGWEQRRWRHEVCLLVMPAGANMFQQPAAGTNDPKGVQRTISNNVFYDLDVSYSVGAGGLVSIVAYIDGVVAGSWQVPNAKRPLNTGFWGSFVRGASTMDIEYLYATKGDDLDVRNPDQTNFLDLARGGYSSGFIEKEFKYNFRYASVYYWHHLYVDRINDSNFIFDEYGPVVHEIRDYDVQFNEDSRPVAHSNLYLSNSGQVETVYYEADAFGARFMLANASRNNVIVKGEDTITFGADNAVNQSMFIYGRSVYQEEEKTKSIKDDDSIRRRGPSKTEFASRYIQTEEMATELGLWVVELWGAGVDEVIVESFGNPFLELGDIVTINYPVKSMFPATHKYFVVAIENSYEGGYKTTLTLRRARFA